MKRNQPAWSGLAMPSNSVALTPGLASFLKSLKTNPIETSIDNLVSYVCPDLTKLEDFLFTHAGCSNGDKSVCHDHVRSLLPTSFSGWCLPSEPPMLPS